MKFARLLPLMGLMTISWIVILVETYVFFYIIVPLGEPIHTVGSLALQSLARLGFVGLLGLGWFAVMVALQFVYTRAKGG
jgi:hypothetical protein